MKEYVEYIEIQDKEMQDNKEEISMLCLGSNVQSVKLLLTLTPF